MNANKRDEITAYLKNRMAVGEATMKSLIFDAQKRPYPRRSVGLVVDKYLRDFSKGQLEPRWVIIPGLRGVGKTTLLAQLYSAIECEKNRKIYMSLDDAVKSLGVSISEILEVYQEIIGEKFELLRNPIYIFLDEVQYDDTWGITLKTLFDKSKKIFIICTGSSALSLHTNPDIARRAVFTKIYPLSFSEYQLVKYRRFPIKHLGNSIRESIFNSSTAEEVYLKLFPLQSQVQQYWRAINRKDIDDYLKFGTLPFAAQLPSEPLIYSQINQTLNSVLNRDVPQLNYFEKQTIDKLSQILYAVASYDNTSLSKISDTVSLDIKTVTSVFSALEKTELLFRVYPYGAHEAQIKKPSKYLFTSPAFRAMYYNLIGSTLSYDSYKGKLFEDVVGLYLHRIFSKIPEATVTYDSAQGGADFILSTGVDTQNRIIIEASLGKKGYQQVVNSMAKIKSRYGLVMSASPLRLDDTKKCLAVPLDYFFLI